MSTERKDVDQRSLDAVMGAMPEPGAMMPWTSIARLRKALKGKHVVANSGDMLLHAIKKLVRDGVLIEAGEWDAYRVKRAGGRSE